RPVVMLGESRLTGADMAILCGCCCRGGSEARCAGAGAGGLLSIGLCWACPLPLGCDLDCSRNPNLLHPIEIRVRKFLTNLAARDVVTILRLRNALRIRRKARVDFAPALDSFRQTCNRFLERRLPLFLRLLLLSGSRLSDNCFRLLHLAQTITQSSLCRY